jgi:predicted AlkP superfamily phosphohydrolase/phosphomutase
MKSNKKVLAIALDAAEPSLIEKWMAEGSLRNLASLRSEGAYGRLSSSADWLVGSPWPTFYTGTMPDEHGIYHYMQWISDKMEYERPKPKLFSVTPFWRQLEDDCRVIALDIPLTFPSPSFNGIEISGWASHDRIFPPFSFPEEKINWVIKNFGKPPISDEVGGLQELDELKKVKEELLLANEKESELIANLMKNESWDLFLCCFTSTHRGGHKFWDITNIKDKISESQKTEFQNYLKEIYQSCDEAIGKILKLVDDDTTVLVFSLHGMGVNTTLTDKMLPKMISNILNIGSKFGKGENKSIIKKIRNSIPLELRSNLRKLLPFWLQDRLTAYWRMGKIDWSLTKVFNLVADLQGYIRINLKGREKEGIVEEGEEYDKLCNQLIHGLMTFKDSETSEPIIERISRKDKLFNKSSGFDYLPDILVNWKDKPASSYRKIVSPEFGEIEWPLPGQNPDGRSGNHRPQGFVIACGEKFKPNSVVENKHIIDLAPTILHYLGFPKTDKMNGTIL